MTKRSARYDVETVSGLSIKGHQISCSSFVSRRVWWHGQRQVFEFAQDVEETTNHPRPPSPVGRANVTVIRNLTEQRNTISIFDLTSQLLLARRYSNDNLEKMESVEESVVYRENKRKRKKKKMDVYVLCEKGRMRVSM